MWAAVTRGAGRPTSIERLVLAAPGSGEVAVAVEACAVCHSDLMYADGAWAADFPVVLGHEAAGRVVRAGEGVDDLAVGDRVVVCLVRSCGRCRACLRGHEVACTGDLTVGGGSPLATAGGEPVAQGLNTGAFAEQMVVHRSQVVPIPDGVPAASASLLGCGVMTGAGAVRNTAGVAAGDTVAVVGCGGVGLGAVQAARIAGAGPIVAIDPLPDKGQAALAMGATHAASPDGGVATLLEATGGHLADHVLVTTAAAAAFTGAADLLAPMGSIVLVGMPADGVTVEVDPGSLAGSNQSILGSKMGTARPAVDVPRLVGHYLDGSLDLDGMVTTTHALDDIDLAFEQVRRGEVVRSVIVFDGLDGLDGLGDREGNRL